MQIEELNVYTRLFDVYGKLLSKKQFEVMDKFLNLDLGESELAEMQGESRQSVHDAISKAKKQLLEFEEKCGINKIVDNIKDKLVSAKAFLRDSADANEIIDDIINSI